MEVVHPIVCVEELRELSFKDEEIIWLTQEVDHNLSKVLGVNLSEVQARYFRDSDAGRDLVEE
jgi:hypothetical protein